MRSASPTESDQFRHLLLLTTPALWEHWPLLPVVRRHPGQEEECGLLCDVLGWKGTPGLCTTVFLCNLFLVPPRLDDFLALPKERFDTAEGIYAAGWRVD
jgi:hypothetical protein